MGQERAKNNQSRLEKLNDDLMVTKRLRADMVYASRPAEAGRPAQKYAVIVQRSVNGHFFASAEAVGRVFRANGDTPAKACLKTIKALAWGIDRWVVEEQFRQAAIKNLNVAVAA